jgi:hypothetical protein
MSVEIAILAKLEESSKKLEEFTNNLDEVLGIETINDDSVVGLKLDGNKLYIQDKDWHWYLVDKHPKENIFKIVGVTKDGTDSVVYVLGKNSKTYKLFLTQVDSKYIDGASVKKCLKSTEEHFDFKPLIKPLWIGAIVAGVISLIVFLVVPFIRNLASAVPAVVSTPVTTQAVTTPATTDTTYSAAVSSMVSILPIMLVIIIIVGVIGAFSRNTE